MLAVEAAPPILTLVIDRPEVRNAVSRELIAALKRELALFDQDPALAVCIITGAGGVFSSGADLADIALDELPSLYQAYSELTRRLACKITVAAIEGYALGGGLELALACDIVVASQSAILGLPEVPLGQFAGCGGLIRFTQRAGRGQAKRFALTGRRIDAATSLDIGLIDEICPPGGARAAAAQLAGEISRQPEAAVRAAKSVIDWRGSDDAGWWDYQHTRALDLLTSPYVRDAAVNLLSRGQEG